jgi:hypothetical protein
MKLYETTSCGYTIKFRGPESVEDYDARAGRSGACLEDACKKTLYNTTLLEWQEAFAKLLQERTGIARQTDQEATSRASARAKNPAQVTPIPERVTAYNNRVMAEWVSNNGAKREQLAKWAQEAADSVPVDPAPAKIGAANKGDLAKANEILTHEPDYIEAKVSLMLAKVPNFPLRRDAENKPEPESLAQLINRWVLASLDLAK